ncbi:hypothetical protein K440DRAFT_644151 [Wilcoxina mikolae CBS 423.85]|nr:hypothetical protein K440DRAFT_644151 [Wilcoxina mikolae CBS 423.85]
MDPVSAAELGSNNTLLRRLKAIRAHILDAVVPPPLKLLKRQGIRDIGEAFRTEGFPYLAYLYDLSKSHFEPLKQLYVEPRYPNLVRITVLDLYDDLTPVTTSIMTGGHLRRFMGGSIPKLVRFRFYFVEDLSAVVMEVLGSHLALNPLFFLEHISDSKYNPLHKSARNIPWKLEYKTHDFSSFSWPRQAMVDNKQPGKPVNVEREVMELRDSDVIHMGKMSYIWLDNLTELEGPKTCIFLFDAGEVKGLKFGSGLQTLPPYQAFRCLNSRNTSIKTPRQKLSETILSIPVPDVDTQNIDKYKLQIEPVLFQLVFDDWLLIASYLRRYLGIIESEIFGVTKVGQMIRWKKSLGRLRYFLPRLEELRGRMVPTDDIDVTTLALDVDIERLQNHIETTVSHIISSVTMHESQRAIDSAESVNQLAELAFIFIPLSYVATVFGMGIPVTYFFKHSQGLY